MSIGAMAQDLSVHVSKNRLGVSDKLQVTFSLKLEGDRQKYGDIIPPSFKNFTVTAGPSTSTQSFLTAWSTGAPPLPKPFLCLIG